MGTRWVSAQHCEKALGNLLVHLNKPEKERLPPPLSAFPQPAETPGTESSAQVGNESRSTKRKRPQDQPVASFPERTAVFDPGLNQQPNFPMPVLQWRGPDFGFDASQGGSDDMTQTLFGGEFEDPSSGGFFSGAGWDAFIEGLGSEGQFNL